MWKTKLCVALSKQFEIDYCSQIKLIKKVGFDAFFFEWERGLDVSSLMTAADEVGLTLQSVHAPYTCSAAMWTESEDAEKAKQLLLECLEVCHKIGSPIMVCHAYIGFDNAPANEYGEKNYGVIVDKASEYGIKIAFENTEGEQQLSNLMNTFKNKDNVGFCWDTGHEMCYNYSKDMMALYGDRVIATHLNDNLGISDFDGKIIWTDDLHLLPFDGVADWENIVSRLNKYGFDDILTFELNKKSKPDRFDNDIYDNMSIEMYLTEAYKRACRVATLKARDRVV